MEKTFRTSMFGFNKDDVAKYIFQQNKGFERKLAEKDAALDTVQAQLDQANHNAQTWAENGARIKQLQTLLAQLQERSDAFNAALAQGSQDLDEIDNSYKSLEGRCEKLESFREKAAKFDSLATALSGIFGNGPEVRDPGESVDKAEAPIISPVQYAKTHWEDYKEAAARLEETCREIAGILAEMQL